jgi:hypothetical protein
MPLSENKDSSLALLGSLARHWCSVQLPEFRQSLDKLEESHLGGEQQALVEGLGHMARGFQQLLGLGLSLSPEADGEPVDLEKECRHRQLALQRIAQSRGLALRTQFDGLIAQRFRGRVDEALLILELLVERALLQVLEGGVDVAIRGIDSAMGYRVEFRVMDSGPGLSGEAQEALWKEPSDWSREPDRLTLFLLKRRAEEVGGGMGVDSKEGVGSCFWFEWPLSPFETNEDERGSELIAQDQIFVRGGGAHQFRSLSIRLERLGFLPERLPEDPSILLVGGVDLEEHLPPILVIALLKESGTSEDQVLEEMMENYPSMRLLVVVDRGVRGDSNYYQVLGASAYLVHSLPPEQMKQMLNRILDWERGDPLITKNDLS